MSDLIWLPGVGATSQTAGTVKCVIILLSSDKYLQSWQALSNNATGLFRSIFTLSDGTVYDFGIPGGVRSAGSANFNRTYVYDSTTPLSGMWGWEDNNVIKSISPIVLNLTDCPMDYTPPVDP